MDSTPHDEASLKPDEGSSASDEGSSRPCWGLDLQDEGSPGPDAAPQGTGEASP